MVMLAENSYIAYRLSFAGFLIYSDLRLVVNNKKVWDAFLKWSTLSHDEAVKCVTGGTFPKVDCQNTDGTVNGCFKPSKPDYISLFKYDVTGASLEEDPIKRNEKLKMLESTILHELVHWGRHKNGVEQTKYAIIKGKFVETGFGDIDVGQRFEMEAYSNPDKPWLP